MCTLSDHSESRGNIPTFIHVSDGKMHDVNVLDILVPEPGAFYICGGSQQLHHARTRVVQLLDNAFVASASTVAEIYRYRWQVELFFKWIK